MKITIPINPTEDVERLTKSLDFIAEDIDIQVKSNEIVATSDNFSKLIDMIKNKWIARTAIESLERRGSLMLNKQALIVGKLNIVYVEQPLGNVKIEIDVDRFKNLLSVEAASLP
jgi:predicted RNA binding protein with dsRBD fold (UPF0201 family)